MAVGNLGNFITALEQRGWLKRIKQPVNCELEITEIVDRVCKLPPAKNVALLFENVRGYDIPVLINAFGSMDRMALALGVDKIDDIAREIQDLIDQPSLITGRLDLLKLAPSLRRLINFPKYVREAPCQEVVITDNPSLAKFPILKCWPGDAGKFITLPLVFTKNPLNGQRNVGMYRLQVYDERTTGMHWHIHKHGAENYRAVRDSGRDRLEAAVAIGGDPALIYAATAPLPRDIDEMIFAGFLRHKAVELVKCKTVDLEVPAQAEIVLEGYIKPDELRREGPFGDHTGYYSLAADYPVFHITCITHRRQPVYPATVVGRPPMEDCFLAKTTERIFLPLLKLYLPEIVDINLPLAGVFHNCAVVSIRKTYPQQAKKVMHGLWGLGQMMFTKLIIVVDESVNVQDMEEVWWRVYNNIDARRDVVLAEGPLDALDHSSPHPYWGTKLGIDATRTWPEEGHNRPWPEDIVMTPAIKKMVDAKWKEMGFE